MFVSRYQNMEYCFYDNKMSINGVDLDYAEMTDITHRGGDEPAFLFTYRGRRITMPYNPEERDSILPFFMHAENQTAMTQDQDIAPAQESAQPVYQEYGQQIDQPGQYEDPKEAEQPVYEEFQEEPEYYEEYGEEPVDGYDQDMEPEQYAEDGDIAQEYDEDVEPEEYVEEDIAPQEYDEDMEPEQYAEDGDVAQEYDEDVEPEEYAEEEIAPQEYEQDMEPEQYAEGYEDGIEAPDQYEEADGVAEDEQPAYAQGEVQPEYQEETAQYGEISGQYEQTVETAETEEFAYAQPEEVAEPVQASVSKPQTPKVPISERIKKLIDRIMSISKKKLLIAAGILVAILIVIFVVVIPAMGTSVDGIKGGVKPKTVETQNGDVYKVSVIDDDAAADEYAVSYYKKCFEDEDTTHWVINKKRNETVLIADQGGAVLVCTFRSVEGEEEDPGLLGTGEVLSTWVINPFTDEITAL